MLSKAKILDIIRRWIAGAAVMIFAAPVFSQAFPSKPVHIVVPFAAGGAVDFIARVAGQGMSESLGQQVLVDNKPGGSAIIGSEFVAKSAPDGYTLLMTANPHTVNPSLFSKLPFDPVKDFIPVTLAGVTPLFVTVHSSVPVSSLKELIALLKANPGKYFYGSSGTGGPQHLAGEMFKTATGTNIVHVPFKGAAPAATALLAGDVKIAFASPTNMIQYVKTGRLKAFAVTTKSRSRFAPELPTLAESGFPGFDMPAWLGLFAPAGTSPDVIARIHESAVKALSIPNAQEKLAAQGIEAVGNTPEQFLAFVQADIAQSAKIVREAGIRPD